MDGSITPRTLYAMIGSAGAPLVIDVRREAALAADDCMIAGAVRRAPEAVTEAVPSGRRIVVYCVHGHEVSRAAAAALAAAGCEAAFLEGGIEAWRAAALPTRRKRATARWVTRARPKVDRIACPWLIRRFIDPEAEISYVPADAVAAVAAETGAVPFDVAGAEFGHVGEACSFDAFLRLFDLHDGGLDRLATIVRGADTGRPELAPECAGLLALSRGLGATIPDDHEMLRHGMTIYDALYAECRA